MDCKKKILFNASTIRSPGGVQGSLSFINFIFKKKLQSKFIFVVSKQVYDQLKVKKNIYKIDIKIYDYFNFFSKNKKKIKYLINFYNPNLVYSIGFPSYYKFNITEIGRQTNGFDFIPWNFFSRPFNFFDHLKRKIVGFIRINFSRNANFLETQTLTAKRALSRRINFPLNKIFIIPNSLNSEIKKKNNNKIKKNNKKIICVISDSLNYKNLKFVVDVIYTLKFKFKRNDLKFLFTIGDKKKSDLNIVKYAKNKNVFQDIEFIGKINVNELSNVYKISKISFCPSVFELFSAVYIESAFFNLPIIAPNLDFIKKLHPNLCYYYDHQDIYSASKLIMKILKNLNKYKNKSSNFVKKNKSYFNDESRNKKILEILEKYNT